jgi:hypothetical protein
VDLSLVSVGIVVLCRGACVNASWVIVEAFHEVLVSHACPIGGLFLLSLRSSYVIGVSPLAG